MLHKSKSKKINQLKYALVIPALALFLMSFNTEEVYINQQNPSTETLERNNVVEVIISKDFTNADLENLQTKLKQEGYTAKFKGIKRNSNNEITAIKIEINSNSSNANYNSDLGTPISPIVISYFSDGHGVKIGPSIFLNEKISKNKNSTKSTSFILNDLINKYKGSTYFLNGKEITEKELKLLNNITIESVSHYSDKGQNGVVEITTKDAKWETEYKVGKPFDSTIIYKKPRKAKLGLPYSADTIHFNYKQVSYWKRSDGKSESEVIKKDAMKLAIVLDSMRNNLKNKQTINKNSLYIIDGKETKINDIKKGSKLAESIESIKVLIGDDATKAYGNKGKDGVVLITTNKDKQETHVILRKPFDSIPKKGNSSKHIIKLSGEPLYIIDGKEEKEEVFEKLNSDEITSVDVLKGDHAIKKYGEKGKHGVIEITTKKK